MWVYWAQSVIIGIFTVLRILMLKLKVKSKSGLSIFPDMQQDQALGSLLGGRQGRYAAKAMAALFFISHYGGFHFVYLIFLAALTFGNLAPIRGLADQQVFAFSGILIAMVLFFVNHLYSFIHNFEADSKTESLGRLMSYPYMRILPMHFTLVIGITIAVIVGSRAALLLFLILKSFVDLMMHVKQHTDPQLRSKGIRIRLFGGKMDATFDWH
jgi:hypothetical protein